ncbi:MAG: glucosamine--fructose-6-phosphate aminotransferase (isomerizing) [Parvicella sp.]|jgi:glucosamine--fructose-6-phosphate aminotransferase (isomerizing)
MLGCGTSWHAALVSEYLFEDICRIPVEVEYASEFRYRNPIISEGDVFIAISQSGETADTLAAIELAKSKGAIVFGVVNAVGSSIARMTHEGAYLHAGPEIGVASTKAFTSQVTLLSMIAIKTGLLRGTLDQHRFNKLLINLWQLPEKIQQVVEKKSGIYEIADAMYQSENMLYLGRGNNFPVALEGALKLKEISYIHAEGYPAAEMKHGPIALIDENMPTVFIALHDESYEKIISNMQEVKSRKGKVIVIVIVTEGDQQAAGIADYVIEIPEVDPMIAPILSVIPLQLLSYQIALLRGCNVDQPRNLAKSVTVE